MLRPLLLAFALSFICLPVFAMTLHIDVTPELVGEGGVTMKPLDANTTRFTIRISTANDPRPVDPTRPFVRGGSLDVRGDHGRILRCAVQPKIQGRDLLYTFDLENEHATSTWFVLVEHFDDAQVGGGKIYSYRLIDFIDPDYRAKELLQDIRPQSLSGIEIPSTLFAPRKNDTESP